MEITGAVTVALAVLLGLFFFFRKDKSLPPGPFLWPVFGCMFSIEQPLHRYFAKLSERYGPLVYLKIGSVHSVAVNSPEVAREVLKNNDVIFANRPDTQFFRNFSFGYNDLIFASYGDKWKYMKRISSINLFTQAKLNITAVPRDAEIKAVMKSVYDTGIGKNVDLKDVIGEYTSGFMCLLLFGRRMKAGIELLDLVALIEKEALLVNIGEVFPFLDRFDLHGVHAKLTKNYMPRVVTILKEVIKEQKTLTDKREGNFLDLLVQLQDEGSLTETNVMALLIDIITAGMDTSRGAEEWTMAQLLRNPHVLKKAQEELDNVIGRSRLVQESDLPNLPYLQGIVKETLRLHPAAPFAFHSNLVEHKISGYKIPAKSRVIINIWAVNRDPNAWKNPDEFKPERFMEADISVSGHNFELIPFSAGRRICAGYPLAMRAVPLAIAALLQSFDWRLPEGASPPSLKECSGTLGMKMFDDLVAVPTPRIDTAALE